MSNLLASLVMLDRTFLDHRGLVQSVAQGLGEGTCTGVTLRQNIIYKVPI